jgi:thiol:disulfide interchange protein|tara:strand:- start:10628 stop:12619 length:1992 start_codon:yes stop_codon:yes gene_type:complete
MKKLILFFTTFTLLASAQIIEPVTWDFSQDKISDREIELKFKASIENHWHLYSQHIKDDGPIPTSFVFFESNDFELVGPTSEGKSIEAFDPNFDMLLKYFEGEAIFSQKLKILTDSVFTIEGEINFMACDDSRCIFPMPLAFSFLVNSHGEIINNQLKEVITDKDHKNTERYNDPLVDLNNPISDCGEKKSSDGSLWTIFILGLLGGLIALITPCVFPMIPLTVSFFTKSNKGKGTSNAIMYGFFIMLIYFLLSIPFHLLSDIDPEILNEISTNSWLNLFFFAIFIVFALSFFGYYDLSLPSKWGNKADSGSNTGGLIGVFFMALTLAIVSFSCTGPILGSLLAGTLGGDVSTVNILGLEFAMVATKLTIGMLGFGIALGLPFSLFALFPKLLNSLPQSGGWLNSVKVVLGFLEVALAIKFLSQADAVEQWGLIKRETFFVLWFIIGVLTVLYLAGKIRFPHDSKLVKVTRTRYSFIVFFILFTIYLIPGMFGAHLNWWEHNALSGFPPPTSYSYTYPPEDDIFYDYWEAIEHAEQNNKAVFIDFTGWACVNCRKMEENVFPKVEKELSEYVICRLYVDEKVLLDLPETVVVPTSDGKTKKKKLSTVGNKWSTLQAVTYASSSQPYYVLYNPKKGLLTNPIGYTPEASEFKSWLKCGLDAFNK